MPKGDDFVEYRTKKAIREKATELITANPTITNPELIELLQIRANHQSITRVFARIRKKLGIFPVRNQLGFAIRQQVSMLCDSNPGLSGRELSDLLFHQQGTRISYSFFNSYRKSKGKSRDRTPINKQPLTDQERNIIDDCGLIDRIRIIIGKVSTRYKLDPVIAESQAMYSLLFSVTQYVQKGCPGDYYCFAIKSAVAYARLGNYQISLMGKSKTSAKMTSLTDDVLYNREINPLDRLILLEQYPESIEYLAHSA